MQRVGALYHLIFFLSFSILGGWRRSLRKLLPPPFLPHPTPNKLHPTGTEKVPSPSSRGHLPSIFRSSLFPRGAGWWCPFPTSAWAVDSLLMALLLLLLLLVHFLVQGKSECHFFNGTQQVQYLQSYFYDRQEYLRFDSNLGKFKAITELGQVDADAWNRDKRILEDAMATVDRFCRYNYRVYNYNAPRPERLFGRRAKPTVSISSTKLDPAFPHTILLCTVRGFYPVEIEVRWLKNGRLEEEGVAFGEELQNGDWTYQLQVLLESQPQRGDLYACQVEHTSLEAPITVQWEPCSSNSARIKLWTGIIGVVLGVAFLAMGLSLPLKSKKATPIQPLQHSSVNPVSLPVF